METENISTIVTPPDFVDTLDHTVTIIDPRWGEIEDLAFFLKTAKENFNVYVYRADMDSEQWLQEAMKKSSSVIVNTINTDITRFKDVLTATGNNVWYYGPKNFLMNKNRIEKPIDYFVNYLL